MSADRLLGSYVVRVLVRNGVRSVLVHDVASAATVVLPDFAALAEHLEGASSRRPEAGRAAGRAPASSAGAAAETAGGDDR